MGLQGPRERRRWGGRRGEAPRISSGRTGGRGVGLVAGFGLDPLGQIVARRIDAVYAYVPLSLSFGDGRLVLHQNIGWTYASETLEQNGGTPGDVRRHALTWGSRADVGLTDRVVAIAEAFGQSRFTPEYQVGLRLTLVRDRLDLDVSYSFAAAGDAPGAFTTGIAWTPPPWR